MNWIRIFLIRCGAITLMIGWPMLVLGSQEPTFPTAGEVLSMILFVAVFLLLIAQLSLLKREADALKKLQNEINSVHLIHTS